MKANWVEIDLQPSGRFGGLAVAALDVHADVFRGPLED